MIVCDCCKEKICGVDEITEVDDTYMPKNLDLKELCANCVRTLGEIRDKVFLEYQTCLEGRVREFMDLPKVTENGIKLNSLTREQIDYLELVVRTSNLLKSEAILFIHQLLDYTPLDLIKLPGLGRESLREIEQALESHGLYLRTGNVGNG